ncbi:diadenylate cyclase CdaA [Eubacteriaceae bacterium ES2]|nr:diadenylate cyclase CdaA [Eubacteriaceae bacterium ES2]
MEAFLIYLQSRITVSSIIEVIIISFFIYQLLLYIRGTQAEQIFKGLAILLVLAPISSWLGFTTLNLIITSAFTWAFIFVVVVFQSEFRSALEHLGNNRFFKNVLKKPTEDYLEKDVAKVMKAVESLAREQVGALIVLEKNTGLKNIINTGIELDAYISKQLLENIFTPNRPLHDGAVIINLMSRRIRAAGCLLPLSENRNLGSELGTRHRAGLGISEKSDAIVIIVSEETGKISYASRGTLFHDVIMEVMEQIILENFTISEEETTTGRISKIWGKFDGKEKNSNS